MVQRVTEATVEPISYNVGVGNSFTIVPTVLPANASKSEPSPFPLGMCSDLYVLFDWHESRNSSQKKSVMGEASAHNAMRFYFPTQMK